MPNTPHMIARELCNWFTVEQLQAVLGVSESTARRYQSGETRPPQGCLVLLDLVRRGRVLPESWPESIKIEGDRLAVPGQRLTAGHLQQFSWILSQWYHCCEMVTKIERQLRLVEPLLPRSLRRSLASERQALQENTGDHGREQIRTLRRVG